MTGAEAATLIAEANAYAMPVIIYADDLGNIAPGNDS